MNAKSVLTALTCLALTSGAAWSIYRSQYRAPSHQVDLHRAVGRALAEETARMLQGAGKIVLILIEPEHEPELKTQLDEFNATLRQHPGLRIKEQYRLEADDKAKYAFGSRLSGRRYVRIVNKNQSADAFVSFVGAPRLSESERAELKIKPRLIAEARAADKVRPCFERQTIEVALVSRFQFPAPVQGTPRSLQEWFDQRWQIITATNAATLPSGKEE